MTLLKMKLKVSWGPVLSLWSQTLLCKPFRLRLTLCIHENTVSGLWTKAIKWTHCGMDLSTLTEGAKEKHQGIENEIVLPAAMRRYF